VLISFCALILIFIPTIANPNPNLEIVVASETLPAGRQGRDLCLFCEIAAHLAGARNHAFDEAS